MTFPTNAITWFSIPAKDFEKSVQFYELLLDVKLIEEPMPGSDRYAKFPCGDERGVTGAVTNDDRYGKGGSRTGIVPYLYCKDLDAALAKVESLGGAVQAEKMPLPNDMGVVAVVIDCDGNPVGLHQP